MDVSSCHTFEFKFKLFHKFPACFISTINAAFVGIELSALVLFVEREEK